LIVDETAAYISVSKEKQIANLGCADFGSRGADESNLQSGQNGWSF